MSLLRRASPRSVQRTHDRHHSDVITTLLPGVKMNGCPFALGTDGALACDRLGPITKTWSISHLDKYCVGYDEKTLPANAPRRTRIIKPIPGEGPDGIAKTPNGYKNHQHPGRKNYPVGTRDWFRKLLNICRGLGPQRHSNGEQTSRAIAMLSVCHRNVGINGGNSRRTRR
ncbi:hypothetical protein ACLK17_09635 [Escherichia coli]